jgi:transposase
LLLTRRQFVSALRRGASFRAVAARFGVSTRTAHKWFHRTQGQRLHRADFTNRPRGNRQPKNRTPLKLVQRILALRAWLKRHSPLGEYGAAALRRELLRQNRQSPSTRTLARLVARAGLTHTGRQRRPPPPSGWHLPIVAAGRAELDAFDLVEGLVIKNGPLLDVFNALSLHGQLAQSWPRSRFTTDDVLAALGEHWRAHGCPDFAQFDNDTRFQGSHAQPNRLGRVVHLCLCLDVIPVFAPPRETGFQAHIESFNHRWQQKVWQRWRHPHLRALQQRSRAYIAAHRQRHAARQDSAPLRHPFPRAIPETPQQHRVIFLRRTDAQGRIRLLEKTLLVQRHWPHRLVRCELCVRSGQVCCYALRRRQPEHQPLLATRKLSVKITPWHGRKTKSL